jgi:hypothetical protein
MAGRSERKCRLGKICVDHDSETNHYTVVGVSKAGEFVISGPWSKRELAEEHAQKIIGVFNEAAMEILEQAGRKIILA